MNNNPCDICGETKWVKLRGNWKRCTNCHYVETTTEKRICKTCGKEIGKYSKENLFYCLDCNKKRPELTVIICSTSGCENKLGKKQFTIGICRQCNREKNDWLTPNGHLWKSKALFTLNKMQTRGELLRILRKSYPELTLDVLNGWLERSTKNETVRRIRHGLYQTTGQAAPEPPEHTQTILVAGEPGSKVTTHHIPNS